MGSADREEVKPETDVLENGLVSTFSLLLRNAAVTGDDKDGRGNIYRK